MLCACGKQSARRDVRDILRLGVIHDSACDLDIIATATVACPVHASLVEEERCFRNQRLIHRFGESDTDVVHGAIDARRVIFRERGLHRRTERIAARRGKGYEVIGAHERHVVGVARTSRPSETALGSSDDEDVGIPGNERGPPCRACRCCRRLLARGNRQGRSGLVPRHVAIAGRSRVSSYRAAGEKIAACRLAVAGRKDLDVGPQLYRARRCPRAHGGTGAAAAGTEVDADTRIEREHRAWAGHRANDNRRSDEITASGEAAGLELIGDIGGKRQSRPRLDPRRIGDGVPGARAEIVMLTHDFLFTVTGRKDFELRAKIASRWRSILGISGIGFEMDGCCRNVSAAEGAREFTIDIRLHRNILLKIRRPSHGSHAKGVYFPAPHQPASDAEDERARAEYGEYSPQ